MIITIPAMVKITPKIMNALIPPLLLGCLRRLKAYDISYIPIIKTIIAVKILTENIDPPNFRYFRGLEQSSYHCGHAHILLAK